MTRTVPDLKPFTAHCHLVTLTQPAVGHETLALRKAEPLRLLWQILDQELIVRMRSFDGDLFECREL
jgi:hypothetical protein